MCKNPLLTLKVKVTITAFSDALIQQNMQLILAIVALLVSPTYIILIPSSGNLGQASSVDDPFASLLSLALQLQLNCVKMADKIVSSCNKLINGSNGKPRN